MMQSIAYIRNTECTIRFPPVANKIPYMYTLMLVFMFKASLT